MTRKIKNKKVLKLVEGEGRRKSGPIMGVDVHKDVLAYCILTETNILDESEVKNDSEGISHLIKLIRRYHVSSVAVESTAQYHFKLMFSFLNLGIPVLVANPQQTKSTQGKKTDKFDARRIAIAHRDGRLKPSVVTSEEIFNLRKAMRHRFNLINQATKIKQRLNQIFHQKDFKFPNLMNSESGLQILEWCTRKMIDNKFLQSVSPKIAKKCNDAELIKALQELQKNLDHIECVTIGNEVIQLRMLELIMKRQETTYYAMAEKNREFLKQMKLLLTIPGVGPNTAAAILAEIADISYFSSPKKLTKWAGLAPRVYQSGHRKHLTGKIHKGGNKYLRRAVVLACQNIYAKGTDNDQLKKFMMALKKKKDSYYLAICAGARKLLSIIWYMLKKGFEWNKFQITPEIKEKFKAVILSKIKNFETKAIKYTRVLEILSGKSEEIFNEVSNLTTNPENLFKTLINSV